ncbi:TetR/AcrR family transcriptional regulator C-terminal domain-containing protein [Herbidospora sp. NBRC 101105]|uniref:TetR/AcrR family transcriptional regulator C-terminal domain-containing protein n=1 Tax=Herbidospora sp. NBRC 101105 TaxID=3032195 RepID=UPI0024A1A27F|nr:TetR/AcrR family transcriptional regulator C-terminal domain-containing protein [Herbidospora sp. NBRC 101105]GLX98335.1 TetR family transcriptional regulator [Herbidospora sp. NBRC 101105]
MARLSRERVLEAAVALADEAGLDGLSMRRLATELGVVPMALYKHVANKDELLDGIIDAVVSEIDLAPVEGDWKPAIRGRILAARQTLLRHPWAAGAIEARRAPTPAVLAYMDSIIGLFRAGGFGVDLVHHVIHALGSRVLGFSQELFDDSPADPDAQEKAAHAMAATYPWLAEMALRVAHDEKTVVGSGCDDQFEFEFALDLLLDGFERLRQAG